MKRSFNMMLIVLAHLFVLRVVLRFTVPLALSFKGLFFDAMLMGGICFIVAFVFRPKWLQKTVYSCMIVFWSFLVVADGVYHMYFETLIAKINVQGLTLMSSEMAGEYDLSIPFGYIFLAMTAVVAIVFIVRQKQPDRLHLKDTLVLLVLAGGPLFVFTGFRESEEASLEYYQSDTFLYRSMHDRIAFSERYGYFTYHLADLFRFPPPIDADEAAASLDAFFAEQPHEANAFSGVFSDANLIIITVESLDSRFIHEDITPTLHMMYETGMRFDNFFVPVFQQGATCNSEFMTVTGLSAINSNDYSNNVCHVYKDNVFPYALPAQLRNREDGYDTYYFHAGYRWFYHREDLVPNYGFETVKFKEDVIEAGYTDFNERFDSHLIDFLYFVDFSGTDPFYVHILTYGLHGAYHQTDYAHHDVKLQNVSGYEDMDPSIRVYYQKMIELDIFLDLLIARLVAEDRYDDTLIVIHTDHYPFMLDQDVYADFLDIDFHSIERFRQSLIMYHPGYADAHGGTVYDTVGSTIDMAPTLLNLLYPEGIFSYFFGTDLFGDGPHAAFLHDFTITDGENTHSLTAGYSGDSDRKTGLIEMHVNRIAMYELQIKLFEIDYFRRMHSIP